MDKLVNDCGYFFHNKIQDIRKGISCDNADDYLDTCNLRSPSCMLSNFGTISEADTLNLIRKSNTTSCDLYPLPTGLLKSSISILLPVLTKMVNSSLQLGVVPSSWKVARVTPLIKKQGLEPIFKISVPSATYHLSQNCAREL